MRWVLEHLQVLFLAAGAIAWWLNQRRKAEADETPAPRETTFEDPELAERTRQIREEIQRKIEQRARGRGQPEPREAREPPPLLRELMERLAPAAEPPRAASRHEVQRQAEILEEQAALAEKLKEAALIREAALKRRQFEAAIADQTDVVRKQTRATVLADLQSAEALRRAFILSEVLGPPLALRRRPAG